ncbi:M24 family metallopeptidase [Clostridium sp. C105KSO13]|uniref:M24 family metallopeptidase n=1 Tax=Clostridium sp. C105KSO13 TaxID=1776045 RepID=UPI00074084E3|nr:Xaa-Pro peptidase family protein [Clostridium sp. C105KSO13]CUX31196.1 putative peptidase [Clostridium sp. C105KSO13]
MNEKKLLTYMKEHSIDAFYVAKKENVRFISGYTGDDSSLLITENAYFFLTDPRYTEQAGLECPEYVIKNWRTPGKTKGDMVGTLVTEKKLSKVAFESDFLSYADFLTFQEKVPATLVPCSGVIEEMRQVKTEEEIQYMRDACEISCRALDRLLPLIKPGITEKELAATLSLYMVQEGADTMPYGNILISGAKTSLLHGIPSEKAIEYGDFVLMDFGCQVNGYMSDMTRTVVVGKATEKQKEVYSLCKQMTEESTEITKAGITGKEIYLKSLEAIQDTPYMGYQYNNIGHGIGLFVHEGPFDSITDTTPIPAGNVRTIEPGIYIPQWGGIRIEDQLLVKEDGYENMVRFTHDLIEL